ncbi:MAG TPA: HDOD domain-containing protein [Bryobacteraceae bacterium]|jgi:HD-like signal output (HDOD) protein
MSGSVLQLSSMRSRTLQCMDKLPRLSPATSQLLARLARPQCSVSDLTSLVERDPVLCGQILRLANSAAFGRARPITTVHHAIAMVGVGTMRKFTLASSFSNLFTRQRKPNGFSVARFNMHAVAVATLAELLAEELPMESAQGTFVAGLLHDIGKVLIAVNLPAEFEHTLEVAAVSGSPMLECERDILGATHAELSGLAASRWELSDAIVWAVTHHHDPDQAAALERTSRGRVGLSRVIHQANAFVNSLGMTALTVAPPQGAPHALEFPVSSFSPVRALKQFELQLKTLGEAFR